MLYEIKFLTAFVNIAVVLMATAMQRDFNPRTAITSSQR